MDIYSIFFKMKVCCVFPSCHCQYKKKITRNIPKNTIMYAAMIVFVRDSRTSAKQPW